MTLIRADNIKNYTPRAKDEVMEASALIFKGQGVKEDIVRADLVTGRGEILGIAIGALGGVLWNGFYPKEFSPEMVENVMYRKLVISKHPDASRLLSIMGPLPWTKERDKPWRKAHDSE